MISLSSQYPGVTSTRRYRRMFMSTGERRTTSVGHPTAIYLFCTAVRQHDHLRSVYWNFGRTARRAFRKSRNGWPAPALKSTPRSARMRLMTCRSSLCSCPDGSWSSLKTRRVRPARSAAGNPAHSHAGGGKIRPVTAVPCSLMHQSSLLIPLAALLMSPSGCRPVGWFRTLMAMRTFKYIRKSLGHNLLNVGNYRRPIYPCP